MPFNFTSNEVAHKQTHKQTDKQTNKQTKTQNTKNTKQIAIQFYLQSGCTGAFGLLSRPACPNQIDLGPGKGKKVDQNSKVF